MRRHFIIMIILLFVSVPGLSIEGDLMGTYEIIKDDQYEIYVYLPSSHFNIKVVETNYSIENSMITNVVNFIVDQTELQLLKQSFTITGDLEKEYQVILKQRDTVLNQEINDIEFAISFLLGGVILFVLYKLLTRKFKENKNF